MYPMFKYFNKQSSCKILMDVPYRELENSEANLIQELKVDHGSEAR